LKAFLIAIFVALGLATPAASFEPTVVGRHDGWTLVAVPHEGSHTCSLFTQTSDASLVITFKDPVGFIFDVYSEFDGSALNLAGITFSKSHQRLSYIYALVPDPVPAPMTRAQIYVGEDQIMYYELQRPDNVMQIALGDTVYDFDLSGYTIILPTFIKCIDTDFVNG
jgi:hypothetical protein